MSDDRTKDERSEDEQAAPDGATPVAGMTPVDGVEPGTGEMADAVGAYLLDALAADERAAFEAYLATSADAQDEVRQLEPVVALLPALFETDEIAEAPLPAPSPDLRAQVVAAATADPPAPLAPAPPASRATTTTGTSRTRTIRTTPEATGPFGVDRTRTRGAGRAPITFPGGRSISLGLLAAGLAGVVAVAAVIWALALQGRIETKDREIRAQAAEIQELRRNANATAFTLAATGGAAEASGTLLFSPRDQIGVLYVQSLPRLDEGRVYQLWYLTDDNPAPTPGTTFRVDRNGNGLVSVDPETPTFDAIALTEEPQGGSDAPTSEILLQGRLGGAAG